MQMDKVTKKVKALKVGDPLDPTSNMGSMISKKHLATVDGFIQKGIDEGAKLLFGGVSGKEQKGFDYSYFRRWRIVCWR